MEGLIHFEPLNEHEVGGGQTKQGQTGHCEAHHCATTERERQGLIGPFDRGLGSAGVGLSGDGHTDETGDTGEHGTHDVGDRSPRPAVVKKDKNQYGHDDDKAGDPGVFPAQEGSGAFLDGVH